MKNAIIIVNYNDAENTEKYVNKIKNYKNINKILVVDNKSTIPDTMEKLNKLKSDKIDVIQAEKNGGYSYGNNFGMKYFEKNNEEFDYIIISNPDVDVEENAIEECLKVIETNENIAVIAPRMFNRNNKPIRRSAWKKRTFWLDVIHSTRFLELLFYKKLRSGEYSEKDYSNNLLEVEAISGAFFIIKSDVFKKIGMFDENVFLFYEEDILAKKIEETGMKVVSLNKVKFIHYESQTIKNAFSYFKKVKQLYKSKMYYQCNYNKINIIQKMIFKILYIFRNIELLIEVPFREILKNIGLK